MTSRQLTMPFAPARAPTRGVRSALARELLRFQEFGKATAETTTEVWSSDHGPVAVPTYTNEFWTAKQRAGNALHEISYRACFKPQLPRFFIERLTNRGERVYDPFMGRGTTSMEAVLLNREAVGCDVSPLSAILTRPRISPPTLEAVEHRLKEIDLDDADEQPKELLVFYHPRTLQAICALKKYFLTREASASLDAVDEWIRMIAINRLTGHSSGFFSVYTLPPNQAVSVEAQQKINRERHQKPPLRDVNRIILKKTVSLLSDCDEATREHLRDCRASFLTQDSASTPAIHEGSVQLVVTSPPFLDVVNYAQDNWLRCWFIGVDPAGVRLSILKKPEDWQTKMTAVFRELRRILVPGGHVAFEVGEVRGGKPRHRWNLTLAGERGLSLKQPEPGYLASIMSTRPRALGGSAT